MAGDHRADLDREQAALAFLQPDETAGQFLARSYVQPFYSGVGFLDHRLSLRPATAVVEVAGLAGTGKTELLLNVAATCVLPTASGGVVYGGHRSHVLFLDLDCKFDVLRLMQIVQGRAVRAVHAAGLHPQHAASEEAIRGVVEDSMSRLCLVRCPSSFALLAALKVARPALAAMAGSGGLGAVLLDGLTAHYYVDKAAKGPGMAPGGGHRDGAPLTLHRVHAAMAAGLQQIQQAHRAPIIATKHILTAGGSNERDVWCPRDVMMKPWQDFVTHRLVLAKRGGGGGSGGGGGGGAGGAAPAGLLAKWTKPDLPHVDKFAIARDGILLER